MNLPAASERLERDHSELDNLFDEVFEALDSGDCAQVYQRLDLFWARLAMHIRAEHLHLFPVVRWLSEQTYDPPELIGLLDELRRDHDLFMTQLARAIKALRLTFDFGNCTETLTFVRKLIEEVRGRLALHNHNEETRLYPLASATNLPPDKAAALTQGIETELTKYPARFQPKALTTNRTNKTE